jgi:hypothetical protein
VPSLTDIAAVGRAGRIARPRLTPADLADKLSVVMPAFAGRPT